MRTIEEIKAEIAAGNFIMGTCLNLAKYNLFNRLAWELIAAREAEIARRVFAGEIADKVKDILWAECPVVFE